ncbi:3-phosphoserine/phosphohydroxythreonine transaminase [Bacillus sp. DTU_2020_1000418_1_SI_GHA_SEK_038]|uniref:3-phosphoserine/phosphohydroxythreonine transaminase n=1 Tax=Bacillus sp. DTU_2020_1000418_1_SI_GHA_SEK_038 TaxID=3077585 RepID=UPI0028E1DAA1|nr:3-phosphoserine/phosphohydroxythreonine transaminase [Bacillus sp. DTU_2020_1000418_1_SI_GHA_SEK_038]WNS76771.1 3-phosphoserine/phosphohydroxythreonine transaminase [Bacillus sp. DTU_2020_1000418_1_SI_GHA_SEK_038]
MKRAFNFNAGPAALPISVLQEAEKNWLNYNGSGMAVMELSHRSKEYEAIHQKAQDLLRSILSIPDSFEVLFLQGGASLQFSMVPMNLITEGKVGNYVLTGVFADKALQEAEKIGQTHVAASSKNENYRFIPTGHDIELSKEAAYLHITSNNTIYGTQWSQFPSNKEVPLIADMSSDILSKAINIEDFDLIYAGAQKNMGPSGVTVVIMNKELLSHSNSSLPTMLNYNTFAKNNSLYNTPPTLAIYLLKLVLEWVQQEGGLPVIEKRNEEKAKILYDCIDESEGFYIGHAERDCRSKMNVTFNLKDEEASKSFLLQAKEAGFIGLNGHRSVGGCRASIYNAIPVEHVEQLAKFMKTFKNNY